MRAAVTKIPHLLYEEDLLKTRKWYMIFIYKIWFMYNDMMGMGEKNPKKYIYKKNKDILIFLIVSLVVGCLVFMAYQLL